MPQQPILLEIFDEEQEGAAAVMAVTEPDIHERGTVTAFTSTRKTKYNKNEANSSPWHAIKTKKQQITLDKQVYVEMHAVKHLLDVASDAFEVIKLYPIDEFRFCGVFLSNAPSSKLH
jgi:hypothetical protein